LEKIGEGGMGLVFRASDTRLGREVALKFLPERFFGDEEARERLQREAQAASALNHANICTVHDILTHEDHPVIVMELLEGKTLDRCLQEDNLTRNQLLKIGIQIADALDAAHSRGLVHRDIKPGNIFVTNRGDVKLLDFGLAKLNPKDSGSLESQAPTVSPARELTAYGSTMGTIAYMSPEQALGEKVDARSDIFSLGVMLYEMWTGSIPFQGNTLAAQFDSLLNRIPPEPISKIPNIDPDLNRIITKSLCKDREGRQKSSREIFEELKRVKRQIDSGELLRTSVKRQDRSSGIHGVTVLSRWLTWRRMSWGFLALVIAILAFRLPWQLVDSARYYPGIVLGEFDVDSTTVPAGLVSFLLSRTLSQFDREIPNLNLKVLSKEEFEVFKTQENEIYGKRSLDTSWYLIPLSPNKPRLVPAMRVSGELREEFGLINLVLRIDCRNKADMLIRDYGSIDELLATGFPQLACDILGRFEPSLVEESKRNLLMSSATVGILSRRWEAVRYYFVGLQARQQRNASGAERELESALALDPTFTLARFQLAELRFEQSRTEEARRLIEEARMSPEALTAVEKHRMEAILARVAHNDVEERRHLRMLIGLQPQKREHHFELAESYFHAVEPDQAINRYLDALRVDGSFALPYNHLGLCYSLKGDHARAIEAVKRYVDLDGSANSYDSLGCVQMASGEYDQAAESLRKARGLDPDLFYAKFNLGFVDILRLRYGSAERFFQGLFDSAPFPQDAARCLFALGFLSFRNGAFEHALSFCERGLEKVGISPSDQVTGELRWLKGMTELELENTAAARTELAFMRDRIERESIGPARYRPIYKYALHLEAMILAHQRERDECLRLIDRLFSIQDKLGYWAHPLDRAFYLDSIGQLYQRFDLINEAEHAFRQALTFNSHFALAQYHLGELLVKLKRFDEARNVLDKFMNEWGNVVECNREVEDAQNLLKKLDELEATNLEVSQ
jgi:serine/threonine protein kinase/tetratricopeptide (TPR) repeat protein